MIGLLDYSSASHLDLDLSVLKKLNPIIQPIQ